MSEPWENEPDRKEWRHAGFPCLIVRGPMGNLCGYVGVPPGHPFFDDINSAEVALSVHGGVTYGDRCQGSICHVPEPGESDEVFWIGFDCGHCYDVMPGLKDSRGNILRMPDATYKDMAYVSQEVERLAEQLRELAQTPAVTVAEPPSFIRQLLAMGGFVPYYCAGCEDFMYRNPTHGTPEHIECERCKASGQPGRQACRVAQS